MGIELSGTNDIVRRNGNLPDEVLGTKSGPSITAEELALLDALPPQSKLKQAYLASTLKTVVPGYQVPQIQALVSQYGNYALGSLAFEQLPNSTLTDTTTVEQQIAVATIPGGVFGPRSHLQLGLIAQCAGAGDKGVGFKVGPASAGIAGATRIGGIDAGLTTHYAGLRAMMWGNGVLGAQRGSPVAVADWASTNLSAAIVTLGIDTNLDWNVYAYVDFGTTGGTNSIIVRSFWGEWKR